jgi:hypothetical protein
MVFYMAGNTMAATASCFARSVRPDLGKDFAAACCCAAASAALMFMTMARDGQAAPEGCIAQQTLQKVVLDLF